MMGSQGHEHASPPEMVPPSQLHGEAATRQDVPTTGSGTNLQNVEKKTTLAALHAMTSALMNIANDEKAAYLQALQRDPSLVAQESDPRAFLKFCMLDGKAAASRLVRYWNNRVKIFCERAFLPMNQTGHGALSREDILVLKTGSVAILPNHTSGRLVLYLDRSRLLNLAEATVQARHRCLFYMLSVISENKHVQEHGYLTLKVVVTPRFTRMDSTESRHTVVELLEHCMPIRSHTNHLLIAAPKPRGELYLQQHIARAVGMVPHDFVLHTNSDRLVILQEMQRHGFEREHLPKCFGGRWTLVSSAEMQRERRVSERMKLQLPPASTLTTSEAYRYPPGIMQRTVTAAPTKLSAAELQVRKRQLNAIHSRQKRERRRSESEDLDTRYSFLQQEQRTLQVEGVRLESLLRQAQEQVALIEVPTAVDASASMISALPGATVGHHHVDLYKLAQETTQQRTSMSTTPTVSSSTTLVDTKGAKTDTSGDSRGDNTASVL